MLTTTLQAHRIETTLTEHGTVSLDRLPFSAGAVVEIIILPSSASSTLLAHILEPNQKNEVSGIGVTAISFRAFR